MAYSPANFRYLVPASAVGYLISSIRYAVVSALIVSTPVCAKAQPNYPERNIRLLFGFSAGTDFGVRLFAEKLAEAVGKSVIVDNVTGAAGNIAADRTAKAAPDGYTIGMLAGANVVINVNLYNKLSFDPARDLAPIMQVYGYPNVLVVNKDVPAKTVEELVTLARKEPGKLTFGHSGLGTTTHLSGEILRSRARIDIRDVPYRGPPPTIADLLSGHITMAFVTPVAVLSLMQEGKLRGLAVTSPKRAPFAPDLPTMDETGFPGFDATPWFGLFAPAATPAPIIEKLNREAAKIVALPEVQKKLNDIGYVSFRNTPTEFAEVIKSETAYWARVIKDSGIQRID